MLKHKILDLSKVEAFADNEKIATDKLKVVLELEEDFVGKKRKYIFYFSHNVLKSFVSWGG